MAEYLVISLVIAANVAVGILIGYRIGFDKGNKIAVRWFVNGGRIDLPDGGIFHVRKEPAHEHVADQQRV